MPFSSIQQSLTGNQAQPAVTPPEPVVSVPDVPAQANTPPYQEPIPEAAPAPDFQVVEQPQPAVEQYQEPQNYQPEPQFEPAPAYQAQQPQEFQQPPQYQQPEYAQPEPAQPTTEYQPQQPASPLASQFSPQFSPEELENILPSELRPPDEELVYEWTAPSRPFKRQDRQFYTTIGSIIFLISLILLFAGQFLTIAVVIAIGFLVYVMSSIPPEMVRHQITTFGVRIDDQLYAWEELGRFWINERMGQRIIHIEVGRFPNHLSLLVGDGDETQLTEIFSQVLLNQEPPQTTFDRAASWLQERFPIRS